MTVRSHKILHKGGCEGVFDYNSVLSTNSILWSELFKEKERRFLRSYLKQNIVTFSESQDAFVISVNQLVLESFNRQSEGVVLCLHASSGSMISSWIWTKLIYPLFKANYSTVLIDWPGFGSSGMNGTFERFPPSRWSHVDWKVLMKAHDLVPDCRANIVAYGDSCNAAVRLMMHHPVQETRQIWFNPDLNLDLLYPSKIEPGSSQAGRALAFTRQLLSMRQLLLAKRVRVWVMYDESYPPEAVALIQEISANSIGHLVVTRVGSSHICRARAGCKVKADLRIFYMSRHMKGLCTTWLRGGVTDMPAELQENRTKPEEMDYDLVSESTCEDPFVSEYRSASAGGSSTLKGAQAWASFPTIREGMLLESASAPTLGGVAGTAPASRPGSAAVPLVLPTLQLHDPQGQECASLLGRRTASSITTGSSRSCVSLTSTVWGAAEEAKRLLHSRNPDPYRDRLISRVKTPPSLDAPAPTFSDENERERREIVDALDASVRMRMMEIHREREIQEIQQKSGTTSVFASRKRKDRTSMFIKDPAAVLLETL